MTLIRRYWYTMLLVMFVPATIALIIVTREWGYSLLFPFIGYGAYLEWSRHQP